MQVLAYTVACVGISAFDAGLIDGAKAEEVMNTLRTLTEESQQVSRRLLCLVGFKNMKERERKKCISLTQKFSCMQKSYQYLLTQSLL